MFYCAFSEREAIANAAHVATLFTMLAAGALRPRITRRFPLERGGEAIALLESRAAIGKLVVVLA